MGRYDRALSVFSPDGRIFQVEYAQLASERGATVVFASTRDTISVAIEKRLDHKLKILSDGDKFKEVEENIYLSFAGIWPDSLVIVKKAVSICRNFSLHTGEKIDLRQLSLLLSDFIQAYTIKGGMRPFGIKIVLFGFVEEEPLISLLEPDGNYSFYKGGSIGQKNEKAIEELESCFREGLSAEECTVRTLISVAQKDAKKMTVYVINKEFAKILGEGEKEEIISRVGRLPPRRDSSSDEKKMDVQR